MQPIKDIPPKELMPGITGYYAHGESLTFGFVELKAGSKIPEHQHLQEQITYVIEGQLGMVIDEEACVLSDGMYRVIPASQPHSAIAITDCRVIDAFAPVREDYKI
jgi:quercetin dioxygenase-like cupin family protein